MDNVEIRKVLVKRVGERTREEVLVSDVNIDGRNLLKYGNKRGDLKEWYEREWNLVYVLAMCLGRTGMEDISFRVDILRLSGIYGLIIYFVMGGWSL